MFDLDKDIKNYLDWRIEELDLLAAEWDWGIKDEYILAYNQNKNNWPDYDHFLFKNIDTHKLHALELECQHGYQISRFFTRFASITGLTASKNLKNRADSFLTTNRVNAEIKIYDGLTIPYDANCYDLIYSVDMIQHISSYSLRLKIFEEVYRVLKPGGHFCFQMGFHEKTDYKMHADYFEDIFIGVMGNCDVKCNELNYIIHDLESRLNFTNFKHDVRPVGPHDNFLRWAWIQVQKPPS